MPGTPCWFSRPPQMLLARIMYSATMRSSGALRWRGTSRTGVSGSSGLPSR
ncbi:Uncharacterised protein [Bordetella pertussis]|nr:Uncharacterised protein [Bordetella pertussis]